MNKREAQIDRTHPLDERIVRKSAIIRNYLSTRQQEPIDPLST